MTPKNPPRCRGCGEPFAEHPERKVCPRCWSEMVTWIDLAGPRELRQRWAAATDEPIALFLAYLRARFTAEIPPLCGTWELGDVDTGAILDGAVSSRVHGVTEAQLAERAICAAYLPDVRLVFVRQRHRHRGGCERAKVCPKWGWQGRALLATFHGVRVMRKLAEV